MAMTQAISAQRRVHWLDNLRTIAILMVVLYHVGGVYEAAGLWASFWIVDDPATISWVGIVGIVFDMVAMPVVFFVSGYLAPASLRGKSAREFVAGKLRRLMLPWALAVLTLIPLYRVIFLYSRGWPQAPWYTYFHVTNPNSQNWLWFLPVLFAFNMMYLLLSRLNPRFSRIPLMGAVAGLFVIGVGYSMGAGSLLGFRHWTLTPLIDFETERVLGYLMVFLLGALCDQQQVFADRPRGKVLYGVANGIAWVPITIHVFARLYPILYPQDFSVSIGFRLIWWLSYYAGMLVMLYVLVQSFRRYFDRTSAIWGELSRNSYGVYLIHVIVIGVIGTLLLGADMPAEAKYLLLIALVYGGSNLLVSAYRCVRRALPSRGAGAARRSA